MLFYQVYDEHIGWSAFCFLQIISNLSLVSIVMDDREENSEIDVTSGFYVLFGSGKNFSYESYDCWNWSFLFIIDPPQLKDQQEAVGWAIYIYNVNISYEAMVFGASFSPFLLSFFYLVNCCFFIITNMMLDSISHIFPYWHFSKPKSSRMEY